MNRYLLDTQATVWLLINNDEFPRYLRDELTYGESMFYVSNLTIVEIVHLQQCNKINLPIYGKDLIANFVRMNIYTVPLADEILVRMSMLPMDRRFHSDPFDRAIIATAISHGLTLVSSDGKFPWYVENGGLDLIEI